MAWLRCRFICGRLGLFIQRGVFLEIKKMLSCVSKSNQFSVTSHYMFKWIMTKYTSVFSVHYISKTGQMYCKWPRTLTLYLQDLILAVVQRSVSLKHFISLTGLILQITFQNRPQECFVHEQASIQMHNTWVCVSLCELWVLNVHVAACQAALCTQRSVGLIDFNNGTNSNDHKDQSILFN